jgi:hypothetical protein
MDFFYFLIAPLVSSCWSTIINNSTPPLSPHITLSQLNISLLPPAGPAPRHLPPTYLLVGKQLSVRIVYRAVFSFHLFLFLFRRKLETTAFHHQLDLRHFAIKV